VRGPKNGLQQEAVNILSTTTITICTEEKNKKKNKKKGKVKA
jgi:hypothetical protein